MQIIVRTNCVVCNTTLPDPQVVCTNTPIYMGVTRQPRSADIVADQKWSVCTACGCVQLAELIDSAVLYATGHTPGTIGNTWNKHHTEFAEFVSRKHPKKVLEIGAGTTLLASLIRQKCDIESYTIIDPNVIDSGEDVRIIRQLLTTNFRWDEKFDTIIHSHTMEHFYTPIEELKALARLMTDDGQMIVSVPLIVNSIIDGFTNGLNFEHTYMTTVSNFYALFASAGLHITTMSSFSLYNVFITAIKDSRHVPVIDEFRSTTEILNRYHQKIHNDVVTINKCIENNHWDTTYIFGAHVFSQVLISNGLSNVYSVLDNDPKKHNQRLYGTPYTVHSPSLIAADAHPTIILRAGQYTKEIEEQLRVINPTVDII